MAFGRRPTPPGSSSRSEPPRHDRADVKEVKRFPWQPEHYIAGNLAIGNLRENLPHRLAEEGGRINAPALMIAAGAIAGFAAQNTALIEADGLRRKGQSLATHDIIMVATKTGARFFFGNLINAYVFERMETLPPAGAVMGASLSAGASPTALPNIEMLVRHITATVGSPQFGILTTPGGAVPATPVVEFLRLWPFVRDLLLLPHPPSNTLPLPEKYWPSVIGLAAAQFVGMVKEVLAPETAASLFVEAALVCSKIDPETVEPGRWNFDAANGRLIVTLR